MFDVLQDTARLLICDNSPPKLNDESVKIFADIIQVVSKHNFDFAMLNMVVALIKQGVEDSRESLAKQMKQFQHSKFKVKNYQDFISPNFSWKVEVALVALSKASKGNIETGNYNNFNTMVNLYVDTLAECFAFVCESSFRSLPILLMPIVETNVIPANAAIRLSDGPIATLTFSINFAMLTLCASDR